MGQLQGLAMQNSPDLKSLEQKLDAASALARQAGKWSNPEFWAEIDGDEQDIGIRQHFDVWGKLGIARQIGMTEADATAAKLTGRRLDLRFEVAKQFWSALIAEKQLALLDQELDAWNQLLGIREGELKAGEITTKDLLTERALFSQRHQERVKTQAQRISSSAALNTLVGRPPAAALVLTDNTDFRAVAATPQAAVMEAMNRNPALKEARFRLQAAGLRVTQEQRRWAPDPSIGPYVRNITKDQPYPGLSISFSVPVFDRNRDGIRAAQLNLASVEQDLQSAERQLAQQAFTAYQLSAQAQKSFDELRAVIQNSIDPQRLLAEQAHQAGGISERELLLVQIDAVQRHIELEALRGNLGVARAQLERVIAETP